MRAIPRAGVDLIRSFEACKLTSYQDVAGVWTVGWGHTRHARANQTITQDQAEAWFAEDCDIVVRSIANVLKPEILARLSVDEYSAICSFAFNLGVRPKTHQIWALINSGQFDRVPARLKLYNKAVVGGQLVPVAGLTRRRRAESDLWETDGEEVVLTASQATVTPTPKVEKKLALSKRLWLGLTAAASAGANWLVEHVKMVGDWAGQLQTLVAPQITHSDFLAKVSSGLAVVAVGAGAAIMILQSKAHKDARS